MQDTIFSPLGSDITASEIATGAVTGSKIAMGSDAQGDILYHNGTSYARLAAGTAGKFLKTGGAGANPSWDTIPARVKWIAAPEFWQNTAGFGTIGSGTDIAPVLLFQDAVTDASATSFVIPPDYDGTTQLTIKIYWAPDDTNTGNCQWEIFLSWSKSGEAYPNATTSDTATQAGSGTANAIHVHTFTTAGQTFEAGDVVGIHIRRQGAHANDTATFDAQVLGITVAWG